MIRLSGTIPPEIWNRFGTKVLSKLRSGENLSVGLDLSVSIEFELVKNMETDLQQILGDLELGDQVRIEKL